MSKSSVTGSVKFFNAAKGFGFIAPEDGGKDVFVPAASIAASGLSRLKAGQRVSFDLEPDAKGPKAVKLIVLEDAPAAPVRQQAPPQAAPQYNPQSSFQQSPQPAPQFSPQSGPQSGKKLVSVYLDSASANGAAETVLEALNDVGETPRLVEVAAAPRDELMQLSLLLREADQSLVRRYDPLFLALQLDDRFISETDFWTGIVEHPSLINGPVLTFAGKARICKTAAEVEAFLGTGRQAAANANSPTNKPKGISPRMAALMRGEALPPRPAPAPPEPPAPVKLQAKAPAKPAPESKSMAAPAKAKPETKPETKPEATAKAKPAAKPETKPETKLGKKAAVKVVKKTKAAPAKAKKKK